MLEGEGLSLLVLGRGVVRVGCLFFCLGDPVLYWLVLRCGGGVCLIGLVCKILRIFFFFLSFLFSFFL